MTEGRERRRHNRFNVAKLEPLKARIDKIRDKERLVTFSKGGCGFFGTDNSWPLSPTKRVFCSFLFEGVMEEPLVIQGNIIYMNAVNVDGKKVVYYGVQFLPSQQAIVDPIVKKLEELRLQGLVTFA
jgi:hypothetical protein